MRTDPQTREVVSTPVPISMQNNTYPLLLVPLFEEIQRRKKEDSIQEEAQRIANASAGVVEPRVTPPRRLSEEQYQVASRRVTPGRWRTLLVLVVGPVVNMSRAFSVPFSNRTRYYCCA